jgi:Zn-dependent protease
VLLSLLQEDPLAYVMIVGTVVVSVVLHELGHAYTATWQGDPTPRMLGHLTWNPVVHMRWLGFILACTVGVAFGATPVNPRLFREGRRGEVKVSFAGPAVNLILAVLASAALVFAVRMAGADLDPTARVFRFWEWAGRINVALFLFNMLPVPPFDGFTVLVRSFRLGQLEHQLRANQQIVLVLVLILVFTGPFWSVVDFVHAALVRTFMLPFVL